MSRACVSLRPEAVTRHLATRVGTAVPPRHTGGRSAAARRVAALQRRRARALPRDRRGRPRRLVTETLRLLPTVAVRVTDENGHSGGGGIRGINVLGHGLQSSAWAMFGGETQVGGAVDATTITPGTWAMHAGASYSDRRNSLYEFDERATSAEVRLSRNFDRGVRLGGAREPARHRYGTGPGGRRGPRRDAVAGWHGRPADDGRLRHARHARFRDRSAPWHLGGIRRRTT